jgi:hypothetical protein
VESVRKNYIYIIADEQPSTLGVSNLKKKVLGDRLKKSWATGVHRGNYKAFY